MRTRAGQECGAESLLAFGEGVVQRRARFSGAPVQLRTRPPRLRRTKALMRSALCVTLDRKNAKGEREMTDRELFYRCIDEVHTNEEDVWRVDGPSSSPVVTLFEGDVMLRSENRISILWLHDGAPRINSFERTAGRDDWEMTDDWAGPIEKFADRLEDEYAWLP